MSSTNTVIVDIARDLGFTFSDHRLVLHNGIDDHKNMRNDVRNVGNDMRKVLTSR